MVRLAELKKIARFGLFGAFGCLAGWLVGEPLLAAALPSKDTGTPSLVSRSATPAVPPPEFKERLDATRAGTGDVQISLIWFNRHDLDLHCLDPNGEDDIHYKFPRSRSGGALDVDSNAGCDRNVRDKPVENIVWATGTAPNGNYQVSVNFFVPCPREAQSDPDRKDFETPFRVRIFADGEETIRDGVVRYNIGRPERNRVIVHTFTVGPKIRLEMPAEATARTGAPLQIPFRLVRVNTPGAATVTATKLPPGVKASTVVVPAGETTGTITLSASGAGIGTEGIEFTVTADGRLGTTAMPLTIAEGGGWSWQLILVLAAWTALLAAGLTAALVAAQNRHMKRPTAAGVPVAVIGAAAAGAFSGGVGQALLFLFASASMGGVGFFAGWLLLGALLGFGVSYFIPNLDRKKATLAGLVGGGLGATAFLLASLAAEWSGRLAGAAILGFAIGLMVALVEVAFRRAWLEVQFGGGEVITVNLGPEPVKVGDDRSCTVWARGAPPVALRYWVRDGRVVCHDVAGGSQEQPVGEGDRRQAGAVAVTVRTTGALLAPAGPRAMPLPATDSVPIRKPMPAPPMPAQPKPVVLPPVPKPAPPKPAPPEIAAAPPKPAPPPMKPLPPPPAKPSAPPVPQKAVVLPPVPKPAPQSAPKPLPPKPPTPTAPPKAPAVPVAAASGDKCPTCQRAASGAPGKRYCMVCDSYF